MRVIIKAHALLVKRGMLIRKYRGGNNFTLLIWRSKLNLCLE